MSADFTDFVPRPPRYTVRPEAPLRLEVSCPADRPAVEAEARLANLSRGGFGLCLAESVTVGDPVMVRVRHEGSPLDLYLLGTVQWQKRQADDTWLIGCRSARELAWETLGELFLLGVLVPGPAGSPQGHPAPAIVPETPSAAELPTA